MVALHRANAEYHGFANTLNAGGVAWSMLSPMPPLWCGDPRAKSGPIARYLNEALAGGFIAADAVPAELLP